MEASSLSSHIGKRKNSHGRLIGVYFSAITAVLSVILAVLVLQSSPILLVYYFISTFFITATVFVLRKRLFIRTSKPSEEKSQQTKKSGSKGLILLFFVLLAILVGPLFLAKILDPATWFILMVSLTSGVSITEIAFYFHTR